MTAPVVDGSRRSAAAQFFMTEEEDRTARQKVVKLLNDATIAADPEIKVENLVKVHDLLTKLEPELLIKYIQDIVAFQSDRSSDVRKTVVFIIEDVVKRNVELLPAVIMNVQTLLQDKAPQVQKRCVQCVTTVYRLALMWLAKAATVTDAMQKVWSMLNNMKAYIIDMVDSENDGLRTQIVKFLENIVVLQTYPEPDSLKHENDFSLEDVPLTLKVARRRKLEEEAMTVFDLIIKFHGSSHISSANLMACMSALTTIAKLRPAFMGKVITALEALHYRMCPDAGPGGKRNYRRGPPQWAGPSQPGLGWAPTSSGTQHN